MGACSCKQPIPSRDSLFSISALKKHEYQDQIRVILNFWQKTVGKLSNKEYDEFVTIFYTNALKAIPECKPVFERTKTPIVKLGRLVFGMFAWIVTELIKEKSIKKMVHQLRVLGKIHKRVGCKPEWFEQLLDVFNETLNNKWPKLYNFRVEYCFTELYNIIKDTMLSKDFYSIKNTVGLSLSLTQLNQCLKNPQSLGYLQKYMQSQFCSELIHFWMDCKEYKNMYKMETINDNEIKEKALHIHDTYIIPYSSHEINLSYVVRLDVMELIKKRDINECLFDCCINEVEKMITTNVWLKFKAEMGELVNSSLKIHQNKLTPKRRDVNIHRKRVIPLQNIVSSSQYLENEDSILSSP